MQYKWYKRYSSSDVYSFLSYCKHFRIENNYYFSRKIFTKSNVKIVFKEEFKDDPIGINSLNYKLLGLGKIFCT